MTTILENNAENETNEIDTVKNIFNELNVYVFQGIIRARVGNSNNCNHVIIHNYANNVDFVYSYNNYHDISFEEDFTIRYNKHVFLYTQVILQSNNDKITIIHKDTFDSINDSIKHNNHTNKNLLLKIDVGDYAIDLLNDLDNETLNKFTQILLTVYDLYDGKIKKNKKRLNVFKKLNDSFYLVHIYANNNNKPRIFDNHMIQPSFKLTYIRKNLICNEHVMKSNEEFPTNLDVKKNIDRNDIEFKYYKPYKLE